MATLDDYLRRAGQLSKEDFLAQHPRPFLVALGVMANRPQRNRGDFEDEARTQNYDLGNRAQMGSHPLAGQVLEVWARDTASPVVRVGRTDHNDLSIPDPSVSSDHCLLHVTDAGVLVEDLGSKNGTFINGQQLGARAPSQVRDEDVVTFGRYNFEFMSAKAFFAALTILRR